MFYCIGPAVGKTFTHNDAILMHLAEKGWLIFSTTCGLYQGTLTEGDGSVQLTSLY